MITQNKWLEFLATFFGLVEVDIEIPEEKYEMFGEMPPIFKNMEYTEEESGEYMKDVISKINKKQVETESKSKTSRKLIASLKASRILMKSTQLLWLLEKGVVITKLYGVIPARRGKPFKDFVEWVSDERRKGDRDTIYAIIAEAAKTVGNSAYGRTGMNRNKFKNVKFCSEKQFNRAKNNYFYYDAEEHHASLEAGPEVGSEHDGIYEVISRPRKIQQNMPIQVAFSVLSDAKLRMLEFYYDCIDKYIDRKDYQYMYMDTDSAYMALSDDFDNLIKPELRKEFEDNKKNWFPRTDTPENKVHDRRKPGLFKIEYEGDGMVALCSKTYYSWGASGGGDCGGKDKFSIKGVQYQNDRNKEILNKEQYKQCLMDKITKACQNKGFRYVKGKAGECGTMNTYEQNKIGLTPIYIKGVVMDDGVHVRPLNV